MSCPKEKGPENEFFVREELLMHVEVIKMAGKYTYLYKKKVK